MSSEEFGRFVSEQSWTFAKSMPGVPHEYVVRERSVPGDVYDRAARTVWSRGRMGRWRRHGPKPYFEHDGWRYWLMTPPGVSTVMNRCALPAVPANQVKWEDTGEVG